MHRQDQFKYTLPLNLARSVTMQVVAKCTCQYGNAVNVRRQIFIADTGIDVSDCNGEKTFKIG